MKLNLKKLYHDTVKQLEKHQTEIEIALAALSVIAFAPESQEVIDAKDDVRVMYQNMLERIYVEILMYKAKLDELEDSD